MKALIIMRGCPGSGKTSLLRELGLDIYALSSDTLRLMYGSSVIGFEGEMSISQADNGIVFDTLYKMLEYRMSKGEFTIIDATHCSSTKTVQKQISEYRKLAKRYNYRMYHYDMTTSDEQSLLNNELRKGTPSYVPVSVVTKMQGVLKSTPTLHREITKIDSLSDFISSFDTDSYEVNVIANSKLVKVKKCNPDMLSLNFTEKAFRGGLWDDSTIKARGLFVHNVTGKVKARSYDKFFNLGQCMDYYDELKSLEFPVRVAKKENGFLGIISWDFDNDCYIFASKSSTTSEHVGYLKENFEKVDFNIQYALKEMLIKRRCSIVFEVVHPDDVHIIDYNKAHKLFLLDFIPNQLHLDKGIHVDYEFSEDCRKEFSKIYEENPMLFFDDVFKVVWSTTVNDYDSLLSYCDKCKNVDFEGYVFTDARGYMTKVKADYYLQWKRCRALLCDYISGKSVNFEKLNDMEKDFMLFLGNYSISELDGKNILDVRQMYEDCKDLGVTSDV